MSSAVGITPYQESFAVDPNEILQKDFSRIQDFSHTRPAGLKPYFSLDLKNIFSHGLYAINIDTYFSDLNARMGIKTEIDMKSTLNNPQDPNFQCAISNLR